MQREKLADHMGYPPRALRVERAAAYLSISAATFLRLVEEGVLPKPVHIGDAVVAWDRYELDEAFERLKTGGDENTMHKLLRGKRP